MADVTVTEVVEVVTVTESVVAVTVTDSGSPGTPGPAIELQTSATHIQWRVVGAASWINLVALADLEGPAGQDGSDGIDGTDGSDGADGVDGREVELQNSGTHIQWRYAGGSWTNLVALSALQGPAGQDGTDGVDGVDGDDGAAATLSLGTVSTGAAGSSVIITEGGTANARVFNFTIPRGDVGAKGDQGDTGPAGTDGVDGAGITSGVVEIDFGSTPTNEASVTVTGQTGIQTTSTVDATVMARSTSNNTITDHQFAANALRFSVSEPVANTGFTITAYCLLGSVTGKFNVNWRWS